MSEKFLELSKDLNCQIQGTLQMSRRKTEKESYTTSQQNHRKLKMKIKMLKATGKQVRGYLQRSNKTR